MCFINYHNYLSARLYPFYATQWHPEMNVFEFSHNENIGKNINHSFDAILVSQYMANFFVNECRKNHHRFLNEDEERKSLIFNYQATYTERLGYFEEQMYIF